LSDSRDANRPVVARGLKGVIVWPYDMRAAQEFGRLAAELRRTGRPMQQIDIQLAAVARTLDDCTVVSSDSDLLAVPGLTVENWAA
jgi:tRNA(fMet)-specific endonuclease VapC